MADAGNLNPGSYGFSGSDDDRLRTIDAIFSRQSTAGGTPKTHEVYVSPVPTAELFPRIQEWEQLVKLSSRQRREYEKKHPLGQGKDSLVWYEEVDAALQQQHPQERQRMQEIHDHLTSVRRVVSRDFLKRFRALMQSVRVSSVYLQGVANLRNCMDLQKENPNPGLEQKLQEYRTRLAPAITFDKDPSDQKYLAVEEAETFFSQQVVPLVRETYPAKAGTDFYFEIFSGKMNSSYFYDAEGFFRVFDHYAARIHDAGINVNVPSGMLRGEYAFRTHPWKGFVDFECEREETAINLLPPVQFSITLSDRYEAVVQPVFDRIRADYSGRIIAPEQVRPWNSRGK